MTITRTEWAVQWPNHTLLPCDEDEARGIVDALRKTRPWGKHVKLVRREVTATPWVEADT